MNWLRAFVFLNLILWFQLNCLGSGYSFYRISIENGLSNNHVNALFKDSYGYIWMGTIDGLDRFDGIEIRPYTSRFPEKVENVHAITEDFYKNATEALTMLADADDKLGALEKYFFIKEQVNG